MGQPRVPEKKAKITLGKKVNLSGISGETVGQPYYVPQSQAEGIVQRGQATATTIAAPTISAVSPNTLAAGTAVISIVCTGTNYDDNTLIVFDGAEIETFPISATQVVGKLAMTGRTAGAKNVHIRNKQFAAGGGGFATAVNSVTPATFTIT